MAAQAVKACAEARAIAGHSAGLAKRSAALCASAADLQRTATSTMGRRLDTITQFSDDHPHSWARIGPIIDRHALVIGRDPAIESAKGILSDRYGITRGQAVNILKRVSQRENRKVRDVARGIVDDAAAAEAAAPLERSA